MRVIRVSFSRGLYYMDVNLFRNQRSSDEIIGIFSYSRAILTLQIRSQTICSVHAGRWASYALVFQTHPS
jgi:hypothetical protein